MCEGVLERERLVRAGRLGATAALGGPVAVVRRRTGELRG